jgi:hypothetical protein
VLFGRGQHALEADHQQVADQVGMDVLGPPAHIVLFEAADPFADCGFDFSLGFHNNLRRDASQIPASVIVPFGEAPRNYDIFERFSRHSLNPKRMSIAFGAPQRYDQIASRARLHGFGIIG